MDSKIKIPWWEPQIGSEEYKIIKQVLDNNFPNEGEMTSLFEHKICKLLGCKNAVAVTSGTVAMFLSMKALGIGHGDEVIIPDMTFIATANAVDLCGAKPVLVDVDPNTLNIDSSAFGNAITKETKAVIPVHVSGRASDMESIMKIADENSIHVVEDAAEAFMSRHKGKYLGTYGKTGCFSFSPNKTITTGQGGIIVTEDDELKVRLRELKDQGRPVRGTGGDDIHNSIGYNLKFTDLQAAVGLGQLNYLETRMERIRSIYNTYKKSLQGANGIKLFGFDIDNGEVPQWTDAIVEKRDELDKHLYENGIGCRRFWLPIHTQKPYKFPDEKFPNATQLSKKALWLPSAFTLSDSDIEEVCRNIRNFLK
jgi:perosamine synthetase|tara:strand:- start:2309 stop:3409 length:1101 start_codon:yes stop_codon:yes gene_type:complete